MRGKSFESLIEGVRLRTGRSPSSAFGQNELEAIKQLIKHYYEWLYFDYDWPHLYVFQSTKDVSTGQTLYDPPSDIDLERIVKVEALHGGVWRPVDKGITHDPINTLDPDANERQDPIQQYDFAWTGSAAQVRVWPEPASNITGGLAFTGRKAFVQLVGETDTVLIDDHLIIGFSAFELLSQDGDPRAQPILANTRQRYNKMKYRLDKNRKSSFSMLGATSMPAFDTHTEKALFFK